MIKQKSTLKGVFKGAAIGFAFVLCTAFFPIKALADVYADWYEGQQEEGALANSITVDASTVTVKKGETVPVPEGVYHYDKKGRNGADGEHKIGSTDNDDGITSSVEVFYKDTNDKIELTESSGSKTFVASRVGRYTITYTVHDNGMLYTYDLVVVSQVSDVVFDFPTNDKNIIPTYYDPDYIEEKKISGDIILPLPTVKDNDGDVDIDGTDISRYTINGAASSDKDSFVSISLNAGSNEVTVEEIKDAQNQKTTGFKISADKLKTLDGQQVSVIYSYYQKVGASDKVFVSSTTKTFTVQRGHYKKKANAADKGYDLQTSWSSSTTDLSAVVGVKKELPSISATTSSTNDPANEKVDIWYEIEVKKQNSSGGYGEALPDLIEENKYFTAAEEGNYNFTYKVHDFYGNTVEVSKTNFDIKNVKDSLSANVYVYDGGDEYAYDETKNEYKSALPMLKSQTGTRNIIMYAVGGTDNMPANKDKLTLRRVVRDNNGNDMFKVTQDEYHKYNLIFAPGLTDEKAKETQTDENGIKYPDLYTQIAADNYHIRKQMKLDSKDPTQAKDVVEWLKKHNYLLVTTEFNKDFKGETIVENLSSSEDSKEAREAMMKGDDHNLGYAYIKPEGDRKEFTDGGTYTFLYGAKDPSNSETTQRYTINVTKDYTDDSIPTLSFSSDLQVTYLSTDTITFDVATATDDTSQDSRLETVTAYRYLKTKADADKKDLINGDKLVPEKDKDSFKKLTYYIDHAKTGIEKTNTKEAAQTTNEGKWYGETGTLIESDGWYYDETKSSYSINLKNAPQGAEYIQILAYAIDDYGNAGFFTKLIKISNAEDTTAPKLCRIANFDTDAEKTKYEAPMDITLPTLTYEDDGVEYMSARVSVYKLVYGTGEDETDKVVDKVLMQSSDMSTSFDSLRDIFTVKAGAFKASVKGTYQVAVTVTDAGNHVNTTYFTYTVNGEEEIEAPEINNITSSTVELKAGELHHLVPPTLSLTENEEYGYIGIDEDDDQHTSTYYTTSIVSATDDYKLDQYYFKGYKAGTYELQYKVFLMQYKKSALKTINGDGQNPSEEGLFFTKEENGKEPKLAYRVNGNTNKTYYLYMEEKVDKDTEEVTYELVGNTKLNGTGDNLEDQKIKDLISKKEVLVYTCLSKVQTIKVGGVEINVSIDDNIYAKTYEKTGEIVEIIKPDNIQYNGEGYQTNTEKSTVTISKLSGNTTTSIGTLTFAKWAEDIEENSTTLLRSDTKPTVGSTSTTGDRVWLYLDSNATYTIKYSIQAMDNTGTNVGDPKVVEYTIKNGDIVAPTLNLYKENKSVVKSKYNIGETMTINMAAIDVKDNFVVGTGDTDDAVNTPEKLIKTLKVEIRNKDLDDSYKTLDNANPEGNPSYSYKFENAGNYVLRFTVTDNAGNTTSKEISFEVTTEEKKSVDVKEVMGGVLIGISCAILAGVVIYFVVSKVRLDKREKQYKDK